MVTNKNQHLTQDDRNVIAIGIVNGSSKKAIADNLGKDKSTIGKEIRAHRYLSHKSTLSLECENYAHCKFKRKNCTVNCPDYSKFRCKRRDRTPGACNGCEKLKSCRFDKYLYKPTIAYEEYRSELVESRTGINLTSSEAVELGNTIKPLLLKGHSPYQIIAAHPELGISEKTLYNYIEQGVFECVGIANIDLRIKVKRKMTAKKKTIYKKRQDRKFLVGRLYTDYQSYVESEEITHILQMDTVYNDISNGPFIQTFKFIKYGLLFAVYHDTKTAADMVDGLAVLDSILGKSLFEQEAHITLTDRGGEFTDAEHMEKRDDGTRRTRVFYCDPMQSGQKGSLENMHRELRYILPNEVDLRSIGLTDQTSLNVAISHINSSAKEHLNGKSPFELCEFMCPELAQKLYEFGLQKIDKDEVILRPSVLTHK